MLPLLLAFACAPADKEDRDQIPTGDTNSDPTDADTDTDTDTDTDADADADADADTDADTDADADPTLTFPLDTTEATCADGLDWLTQLYTTDGARCTTTCPAGQPLFLVGMVVNACATPLTFDTFTAELIAATSIVNVDTGIVITDSIGAGTPPRTTWVVDPGLSVWEAPLLEPLEPGNYQIILSFNDPAYHSGFLSFVVE